MYKLKSRPEDFIVKEELVPKLDNAGDFAYFKMTKKGFSTEEAIGIIQRITHIPARFLNYSGLKDKHAVTEQLISVRQEFAKRIDSINLKDITFEYIGRGNERLSLGSHTTNYFEITVRNLENIKPEIPASIPNYYDEQRFSHFNAAVGKHMIKKEFLEAVKIISSSELSMERKAREWLTTHPKDYVGALRQIPKKILLLYVHAYQSLLFNKLLAKRIESRSQDYWISQYSQGAMYFPKDRFKDVDLPIIGFATDSASISEILEEEGIKTRDFILPSLPDLSVQGGLRSSLISLRNVNISSLKEDELNVGKKKCMVSFSIGTGCYATMVIRSIFGQ